MYDRDCLYYQIRLVLRSCFSLPSFKFRCIYYFIQFYCFQRPKDNRRYQSQSKQAKLAASAASKDPTPPKF